MSSALSHSSSRSIATRVMYGVALVALLAFGVAAAASYLRSSQALLTGARATMEGLASLEAQRISGELVRAFDSNEALAHALLAQRASDGVSRAAATYSWIMAHPARVIPIVGSQQTARIAEAGCTPAAEAARRAMAMPASARKGPRERGRAATCNRPRQRTAPRPIGPCWRLQVAA